MIIILIICLCRESTIVKFNNNKCEKQKKNKLQKNSLHGLVATSRSVHFVLCFADVFKLTPVTFFNMRLHFFLFMQPVIWIYAFNSKNHRVCPEFALVSIGVVQIMFYEPSSKELN